MRVSSRRSGVEHRAYTTVRYLWRLDDGVDGGGEACGAPTSSPSGCRASARTPCTRELIALRRTLRRSGKWFDDRKERRGKGSVHYTPVLPSARIAEWQ